MMSFFKSVAEGGVTRSSRGSSLFLRRSAVNDKVIDDDSSKDEEACPYVIARVAAAAEKKPSSPLFNTSKTKVVAHWC